MALAAGTRLGPYEVIALIGEGGMGQVYRATDTNLKRSVAIKLLPDAMATDAERLARFQREAEVLARLNHPNIAQIHGLERSDGTTALVMEFVEGPTLADRIALGPIPPGETLLIAKQIAEALEGAHEQGIIHRDLKPANVKVRPDGTVKVLDFGLAKPVGAENATSPIGLSSSPTLTSPLAVTGAGVLLGTAAYMSPEQARGQAVDKRTDIWAFGCVLYELLTGRVAFGRATITDTLAAIVEREPVWDLLPVNPPPVVRRLLRRCLEKAPRRRLRDVGDARLELEEALSGSAAEEFTAQKTTGVTRRIAIGTLLGATAGAAATGILAVSRYRSDATPRSLARFAIPLPEGNVFRVGFNKRVAISPDGAYLACNPIPRGPGANIFLRSIGELEIRLVDGLAECRFSRTTHAGSAISQRTPRGDCGRSRSAAARPRTFAARRIFQGPPGQPTT